MYELPSSTVPVTSEAPLIECPRCGVTTIAMPMDKPAVARPLLLVVDDEPQVVERLAANADSRPCEVPSPASRRL